MLRAQSNPQIPARVDAIRFWSFGDVTRVAIETQGDYRLYSEQVEAPSRVFFDLNGLRPPTSAARGMQTIPVGDHRLKRIRIAQVSPGKTRIVFDLECPVEVISSQLVNPDRLMIEIRPKGTSLPSLSASHSLIGAQKVDLASHQTVADSDLTDIGIINSESTSNSTGKLLQPLESSPSKKPAVLYKTSPVVATGSSNARVLASPPPVREIDPAGVEASRTDVSPISDSPAYAAAPPPVPSAGVTAASSDSSGDRSLVRVFGLKLGRVVIDAGHGGHDSGSVGPNGLKEKDLVLDVALRLGALITKQLGAEVVYTRSSDVFIPLEERTRIANQKRADLFISVHANSSSEPTATGVETYYFNLASDKQGLDLATRENATAGSSISDLSDLLHRAVLQTKLEESREFAQRVQTSLWASSYKMNNRSRDRGVRQAPFVVLIGATMPSILAEIGFISNPRDEKLLKRSDQRDKIAEGLLKGITQYANSLSHTQLARAGSK